MMVIISKATINQFIENHPRAKDPLLDWYIKTKESDWANVTDVRKVFRTADYVGNDLFVFNIKGNSYRLIARIIFGARTVFIRFIGTHAQYDQVILSRL